MAGREILASVGLGQKYSNEIIGKVHRIGNNLGLPQPALADTLEGLEEDVEDETGVAVRFPLDEEGAEVLLVTPSADFFAEPHVDGLIGYAKVFHQAGIRWTLSTRASEAANFGLFIGSYENMRKVALRIREGGPGARREADRVRRVRTRLAGRLQLPPHAGRPVRLPRPALSGSAAHRGGHPRPDPPRRAHPRPVGQRRTPRHLPRFLQRGPRFAHGRPPRRTVHLAPRGAASGLQPLLRHGAGHHRREHLLLRRGRGVAHRRPRRAAGQGGAAPNAGVQRSGRAQPRDPHRRHLRDLQEPVRQGAAVLRIRDGPDTQRAHSSSATQSFSAATTEAGIPRRAEHEIPTRESRMATPLEQDLPRRRPHLPQVPRRRLRLARLRIEDLRRRPLPQVPDLRAPHPAVPGKLPGRRRGHPGLAPGGAGAGEAARGHELAGVRVPPRHRRQPVPVPDGPGLPGAVRGRLQPQRGGGLRRDQRRGAVHRRHRHRGRLRVRGARARYRQARRDRRRRSGRTHRRVPAPPARPPGARSTTTTRRSAA